MRQAAELSRESLIEIVEALQGHLYLDLADSRGQDGIVPHSDFWNPDKPWSIDLLDSLGRQAAAARPGADRSRALRDEAKDGPDEPTSTATGPATGRLYWQRKRNPVPGKPGPPPTRHSSWK